MKLAYASYESLKDEQQEPATPVMLMHGLFGSKTNWNSLAKALHQQTNRKVHNNLTSFDLSNCSNFLNQKSKNFFILIALPVHDNSF